MASELRVREGPMYILLRDEVAGEQHADAMRRWDRYREYLDSIRDHLPHHACEFATASWHYDVQDPRCLHDAWVESLTISEPSSGDHHQHRQMEIHTRLVGAYHNGHNELTYRGVRHYALHHPGGDEEGTLVGGGHGDWIVDEIRLSDRGLVLHEVEFRWGAHWVVECADIEYQWLPLND